MHYILILALLAGCNPFGAFRPTSDEIQVKNWAPNPEKTKPAPILYSYRTLGDNMYYSSEQPRAENRLVGKSTENHENKERNSYFEELVPYPIR